MGTFASENFARGKLSNNNMRLSHCEFAVEIVQNDASNGRDLNMVPHTKFKATAPVISANQCHR